MKKHHLILTILSYIIICQSCSKKIIFKDSLMEMNKPGYLLRTSNKWSTIEEEKFRLHISKSIEDENFNKKLQSAQIKIFDHLLKLIKLGETKDSLPKIEIFVFKDMDEKYENTQVRASAHALPPYYAAYYIKDNAEGAHEITHILNSHFWKPFTNGKYNMLLNEGFSFYSDEGIIFKFDFYQKARNILKDKSYQIKKIATSSAGNSYEKKAFVSGAFVKYLIESYGILKFKELWIEINNKETESFAFEKNYNLSLQELEREFYAKLKDKI